MIASEVAPWAKTGGLADVLSGLPEALDSFGHQVTVVLPKYRGLKVPPSESIVRTVTVGSATFEVGFPLASLARTRRVVFVDCPPLFDRDGLYSVGGHE